MIAQETVNLYSLSSNMWVEILRVNFESSNPMWDAAEKYNVFKHFKGRNWVELYTRRVGFPPRVDLTGLDHNDLIEYRKVVLEKMNRHNFKEVLSATNIKDLLMIDCGLLKYFEEV